MFVFIMFALLLILLLSFLMFLDFFLRLVTFLFMLLVFVVVGGVAGILVDAVIQFMEGFAAVLSPPPRPFPPLPPHPPPPHLPDKHRYTHIKSGCYLLLLQSNVNYLCSKDLYLMYHLILSMYGLGLYMSHCCFSFLLRHILFECLLIWSNFSVCQGWIHKIGFLKL